MGFPNVDPNAIREQQQLGRMRALKQSKNASPISAKKALLIVAPVFIVALAIILLFSGVFDKGYTLRWNEAIYRISDVISEDLVYDLPEGYESAGHLIFTEDPKKAEGNLFSNWTLGAELYVDPSDDRTVYISAYKGFLKARKK